MVNPVHQIRALTEKTPPPLLPADKKNSKLSKLLKVYLSEEDIERIWQAYVLVIKHTVDKKDRRGRLYFSSSCSSM